MNELQVAARSGKNLYVIVLDEIGQVSNGVTYETMETDHWQSYAIPAIEVSGAGLYFASMPESPPGVFSVMAYARKGAVPDPSDGPPISDSAQMQWDGEREIPFHDLVAVASGVSGDPWLLARLYGNVSPLDEQGTQVFYDVEDPSRPRVRLSPTNPRGGRIAEKLS